MSATRRARPDNRGLAAGVAWLRYTRHEFAEWISRPGRLVAVEPLEQVVPGDDPPGARLLGPESPGANFVVDQITPDAKNHGGFLDRVGQPLRAKR